MEPNLTKSEHSAAWHLQSVVSFVLSFGALLLGIAYLPADPWQRAFHAVAAMYSVTSTISLSKTLRDEHEAKRLVSRVDTAKIERFLAEQDPFRVG